MVNHPAKIAASGCSIYDIVDDNLFIPKYELEILLSDALIGLSLAGLPLRTRSKVVKSEICIALGYPIPNSFSKTQPRFPGQNFDVYTQKSMNVQVWNQEVDPTRRYVFLKVNDEDIVTNVKVITGDQLAAYDRTGTLTTKYQATMRSYPSSVLFSNADTPRIQMWIHPPHKKLSDVYPNKYPSSDELLPISEIYRRLLPIVGQRINYIDAIQERNRGAALHALICHLLGYSVYDDDGSYPDIANQLLEIKLQTSPTIDLGLHSPDDGACVIKTQSLEFYSDDIRYAILDADVEEESIILNRLYVVSGKDFSRHFPLFSGKVQNAKLQIPLPSNFFN